MGIQEITKKLTSRTPTIMGSEKFTTFAVLLPLINIDEELHVLFEVRSKELRRQPGEICFPGGRMELTDRDAAYTAIRETAEELCISHSDIHDVTPLDYVITPYGTAIYPFAGYLETNEMIKPNPEEVAEVFTVPLTYLKNTEPEVFTIEFKVEPEKDFPYHQIVGGEKYQWQMRKMEEIFYYYEDKVIWGLTARILQHFIKVIK